MSDEPTYGPGDGPPALPLSEERKLALLGGTIHGVLATTKRDGLPHLTNVIYAFDPEQRVVRVSTMAGRLKVTHLRRDPRCVLHVSSDDRLAFAVAEGVAELSPVTTTAGDEVGRELLRWDRAKGSQIPAEDEPAYLAQLVKDERLVIRIPVARMYGTAIDVG